MTQETKKFEAGMTIGDALRLHPRAGEVFAAFHLGGCSHCAINEAETIEEVTAGYGVDSGVLLEALNGLLEE
jgi:hybrid cluster-associated redox disulfide protein